MNRKAKDMLEWVEHYKKEDLTLCIASSRDPWKPYTTRWQAYFVVGSCGRIGGGITLMFPPIESTFGKTVDGAINKLADNWDAAMNSPVWKDRLSDD